MRQFHRSPRQEPNLAGGYFHVRVQKGLFRSGTVFNLSGAEARGRFAIPWAEGREVLVDGRAWRPLECKLTIYEGTRLSTQQQSLGQGWLNAVKFGENVTDAMLEDAVNVGRNTRERTPVELREHKHWRPTIWGKVRRLPSGLAIAADAITVVGALGAAGKLLGIF